MLILSKKPLNRLTQIEITISLIIILILISLGTLIYQNHLKKMSDNTREQTVNSLAQSLETFYLKDSHGFYPSLANLQNNQWLSENVTKDDSNIAIDQNQNGVNYVYISRDASATCQNPDLVNQLTVGCDNFKLMVRLSDGEQYTKLSHNGL